MIEFPKKKFEIIYADPPYTFKTYSNKGMGRSPKYDLMSKEDIQSLPVKDITADNCILFLWVTFPCLEEGLELIKAWGFEYKTLGFCWIKVNKNSNSLFWGMGYWTRSNPELCLIATKGSPKRISADVHSVLFSEKKKRFVPTNVVSVIMSRIRRHSEKPDEIRDLIVRLCGNVERIELFARKKTEGWDVWGNEV